MKIVVTAAAEKQLRRLPPIIAARILKKARYYSEAEDVFSEAVSMQNMPGMYRWRVGVYRVIFSAEKDGLVIHRVGHRKDIYGS